MLKRFVLAFVYFVALIVPAAFALALLAAPASPAAPIEQPGCDHRELGRLDADVAHINEAIAQRCS
jgi:hypothetical protein